MKFTHRWNDWDPYEEIGERNPETIEALAELSDRAVIGYAVACAEWTTCRLAAYLDDDPRAEQYIDALWLYVGRDDVALPVETKPEEWVGEALSYVEFSLVTALNAIRLTEDAQAELEAAWAERIAIFVNPEPTPFHAWRAAVLLRLKEAFPYDPEDGLGAPVVAEHFDPFVADVDVEGALKVLAERAADNPYVEFF